MLLESQRTNLKTSLQIVFALVILFNANQTWGFVENISHGYASCLACHVSPSGGGLLNDYGRSLSKELMSQWGWASSEEPLFGAARNSDLLKIGGDYRAIQTYFDNSEVKQGKQFLMQGNIELGVNLSNVSLVGTIGTQEGPEGTPKKGQFLSERHYVLWNLNDELKVRAGKFRLSFGLFDPNHTRVTKQPLGFGPNSESYILEFSKFSETDEFFISADLGRIDLPRERRSEKSISFSYIKYTSEKSKIGMSGLVGESDLTRRSLLGVFGIGRLGQKFILKAEVDYQQSEHASFPIQQQDLAATVVNLGYELVPGVLPYVLTEHLQQDLTENSTQKSSLGAGVQWLPIPHIEIQGEIKKQMDKSSQISESDNGWLVFHFYF